MSKKLIIMTAETSVVVYAEDEKEAIDIIRTNITDITREISDLDFMASYNYYIPEGWDENCIPYGSDDDRTIKEILEEDGL